MQIEIKDLLELTPGDKILYDGDYLKDDMKVLWDFYKTLDNPPFEIDNEWDFEKFLMSYLSNVTKSTWSIGWSIEGWLELTKEV